MNTVSPSATRASAGPGAPSGSALITMLRTETRLFIREPVALVWGFALPTIAFLVLALIPGLRHPIAAFGGASALAVYQPVIILFAVLILALNALPPILTAYRERGVLRRLQTTPMPPIRLLGALVMINLVVALATAVAVLIIGAAVGLGSPGQLAGWVLAYLLAAAAMLSLGVLIAALSPTSKIANGIGVLATFPLLFFAGLWIPLPSMPHLLRTISEYTPLGAAVRAMTAASGGQWPSIAALATLAGYVLVCCWVAARYFRW